MIFSIITPTTGKSDNLEHFFDSLNKQIFTGPVEVILITTDFSIKSVQNFSSLLPKNFNIKLLSTTQMGIAVARNIGLQAAQGTYVLFLDDDCALPDENYLSRAAQKLSSNFQRGWAGSYNMNDPNLNFYSSFYNYLSLLWLKSFSIKGNMHVVLGGCALFHREDVISSGAFFEDNNQHAGEEYSFSQKILEHNISIQYSDDLNVNHNPKCTLTSLLKKSWYHGRALDTYPRNQEQKRWTTYLYYLQQRPLLSLFFTPLLILFLVVGRIAFVLRKFSQTVVSIRKPYLKRS